MEQASGKSSRQVMQLLAEVDPELAAPADRARPPGRRALGAQLKAAIDDECRRGLERLKELLSHVDPHLPLGQLMGRLVREGLDRHDPARPPRGRRAAPAKGAEQTSAAKTRRLGRQAATTGTARAAPPARTENFASEDRRRDRGRCRYVDRTSGRRCGSQHLLQIDHVAVILHWDLGLAAKRPDAYLHFGNAPHDRRPLAVKASSEHADSV